jgi:hypothetical protein
VSENGQWRAGCACVCNATRHDRGLPAFRHGSTWQGGPSRKMDSDIQAGAFSGSCAALVRIVLPHALVNCQIKFQCFLKGNFDVENLSIRRKSVQARACPTEVADAERKLFSWRRRSHASGLINPARIADSLLCNPMESVKQSAGCSRCRYYERNGSRHIANAAT